MPRARDLLERFRPAGAPGGATAAGTPVDRSADMAAELTPVFAALAPTQAECVRIRDSAHADASATLAAATEQANALRQSARERIPVERTAAAAEAIEADRGRAASEASRDEEQLEELLERGRAAIPRLVSEVVQAVRHSIDGADGVDTVSVADAADPVGRGRPS